MMKLYTARVCPFAQRARLALREKGQPYETIEIDLGSMPEWYKQKSPNQKVPLLELEDGRLLWESAVIAEYVDEALKGPALMPADPFLKAEIRIWLSKVGDGLIPRFYQTLRGQEEPEGLQAILQELESHDWRGGPFWLGQNLTLADIFIFPWFERWPILAHYRGLPWEAAKHPKLTRWKDEMHRRPSVTEDACTPEFFIENYAAYADGRR